MSVKCLRFDSLLNGRCGSLAEIFGVDAGGLLRQTIRMCSPLSLYGGYITNLCDSVPTGRPK